MPWPLTMSPRTAIVISARPGAMPTIRIPSACEAGSLANMRAATHSASRCASASFIVDDSRIGKRGAGGVAARDQRREPVAVLPVMRGEIDEHVAHARDTDLVGPAQRPARVVDALLHRGVDIARRCDAVRHRIG